MNHKILFKRIKKENLHLFWQPLAAILDLYLSKQFPGNAREFFLSAISSQNVKIKRFAFLIKK